jgi:hypothetical protein
MSGRWDNSDLAKLIERDAKLRTYELPPEAGQADEDKPDIKAHGGVDAPQGEDKIHVTYDGATDTHIVSVETALGARAKGQVEPRRTQADTDEAINQMAASLLRALHSAAKGGSGKGDKSGEGEGGGESDGEGEESKDKKKDGKGKGKGKSKQQSPEEWLEALKRSLTGVFVAHGYNAEPVTNG